MARLPVFKAAKSYADLQTARFHMPGHKGMLYPYDVTEVPGTDNLNSPTEAILESEQLCAKVLGAKNAFFVVNGSTACNLAMLFTVGCGKRVLLGRGCHKSAINAVALAGQEVFPLFPDEYGTYTAEAVDKALTENPCDAVFLTSPSYRGEASPIAEIAEVAHRHGALLLVDGAHGAHFAFSDQLPPVPKEADIWCVSSHKTLAALTQTAILLTGESCPYSRPTIQRMISVFQSTSPSYELMFSIERSVLEPLDWDSHINRIAAFEDRLRALRGVRVLGRADRHLHDITRVNISTPCMTGHMLGMELEKRGVYPEMADVECVTLITTPADKDEWYDRCINALEDMGLTENEKYVTPNTSSVYSQYRGDSVLSVREALTGNTSYVSFDEAAGRISAQTVGCYPPGTAILFPGEKILPEAIEFLLNEERSGAYLFGLVDRNIVVVDED
ncbi:MAG: aminotransferase class V-fold PLP-dependent enzyme [Clostridia bacterium]|nr:aminotransferase class V-fold PLP-dependent enzyme [Clostridia bacterium]